MRVGLIAAMTPTGVIGINGALPWRIKADLQRFKTKTLGSAIVFGWKTWVRLPRLPGRNIFVVSREHISMWPRKEQMPPHPGGICSSLQSAVKRATAHTETDTVWVGGGGQIYRQALSEGLVDFLDITIVPEIEIPPEALVTWFPVDLLVGWQVVEETTNADDPRLLHRVYHRR